MRILFFVGLATVLPACADDIVDPANYDYRIARTDVVAGSDVVISSAAFARERAPRVSADAIALDVTRLNDTTVLAAVPATAQGTYTLRVADHEIGVVHVAGFVDRTQVATELVGRGYATSVNDNSAWILGTPDRRVVRFFPASNTVEPLLENYLITVGDVRGAGVTPEDDVVLLSPYRADLSDPWRQPVELWQLDPLQRVGTLPIVNTRVAALFNDSVFLKATHHTVQLFHLRNGVWEPGMFERYEETYEVVLSPRRDRAALLINWATNTSGVPIFDTRTGDTAYHVSALRNTKGAHFSANGNTLYLIGQTTSGSVPSAVIAVSAASGAELWRFEFSEWIVDSAFDPAAGMLYLVSADAYSARSDTPEVYVLDTATPELLGRMQASVGGTQGCDYPNTIVGPDGVFYLCNEQVWRFDRVE